MPDNPLPDSLSRTGPVKAETDWPPLPQAAGLLTEVVPQNLAIVEAALRQFLGQAAAEPGPTGLLYWAALSSLPLAAGAGAAARRRAARGLALAPGGLTFRAHPGLPPEGES
jgi:hypothetical protein